MSCLRATIVHHQAWRDQSLRKLLRYTIAKDDTIRSQVLSLSCLSLSLLSLSLSVSLYAHTTGLCVICVHVAYMCVTTLSSTCNNPTRTIYVYMYVSMMCVYMYVS